MWRKESTLPVGTLTRTVSREQHAVSSNAETKLLGAQSCCSWACIQRADGGMSTRHLPPCSLQHRSPQPRWGANWGVQPDGQARKWDVCTQGKSTQAQRASCHLQRNQENWRQRSVTPGMEMSACALSHTEAKMWVPEHRAGQWHRAQEGCGERGWRGDGERARGAAGQEDQLPTCHGTAE